MIFLALLCFLKHRSGGKGINSGDYSDGRKSAFFDPSHKPILLSSTLNQCKAWNSTPLQSYYIIFDNTFLIEKSYELFLNDFWFESVKPDKIDIRDYKGKIGRFFEQYICSLLKDGLKFLKHPPIKCLDELKETIN